MGDTVTATTSFSLSPIGVSIGLPTITESTLPWTGRILTDPRFETSIISSSFVSASSTISSLATSTAIASNPTSSKWTTQSFTTSSASTNSSTTPTSLIVMTTPGNLTVATSLTSDRGNVSRTVVSSASATYSLFQNVSTCSTLSPGQPVTIWSILPNTTTTTMTVTGNWSTSTMTPLPEFTPPVYCPTNLNPSTSTSNPTIPGNKTSSPLSLSTSTSVSLFIGAPHPTSKTTVTLTDSLGMSSTIVYIPGYTSAEATSNGGNRVTVTSVTTSKNGVTEITSVTLPNYGNGKTDKATVDPSTIPSDSVHWIPQTEPPHSRPSFVSTSSTPAQFAPTSSTQDQFAPTPITTIFAGNPAATTPLTEVIGGVTVVAAPSKATIGSQTVIVGPTPQTVTESGQVFTVSPNEIVGPSVIISIPTYTSGGVFVQNPTPTTVNGVSIGLGAGGGSSVVIGGTTFNVAPDAPKQTIVNNGQTIVVGSGGIAFDSTTITPAPVPPAAVATSTPTNIAVVGGSIITAVGSSIAVIAGQTFTYGPSTPQTTTLFNGELITIAPAGIIFHGSTIGGTALSPASSQIGIVGGVSITEIGSSLAIISGTTFTIGPGATPTTAIIASQIVSAGPDGFSDGSFTWNPFPPATATKTLTAGSVTFSELGSLVVIGSQTFTFGLGAKPTTDVYAGQTISIGPNGIGFSSTTFTSLGVVTGTESGSGTETGTAANAATTTTSKNGGGMLSPGPVSGVLGLCMCVVVGFVIL